MYFGNAICAAGLSLCLANSSYAWDPEIGEIPRPLSKIEFVDGTKVSLEALRGNPVVLYFGADWCEPCRMRGRPAVNAAQKKYKSKGLQTIFVSMDDNNFRKAKIRESEVLGIPIAMAKLELCPPGKCLDGLRDQGEFGRIYAYPTAIILDSSGVVRTRLQGGRGVESGLDSAVDKIIGK